MGSVINIAFLQGLITKLIKKPDLGLIKRPALLIFLGMACMLPAQAQAQEQEVEVRDIFQTIKAQNRFIDALSELGTGENNAFNLPIGIKKIIGNTPLTLAISNVKFTSDYGELSLYAMLEIPQGSKELIFGASGIKITNDGDLTGEVKLSLLNDVTVSIGSMGEVTFKGSMNEKTGASASNTFVSLECNGDLKELGIEADITLNQNSFVSASDHVSPVTASFKVNASDWNDMMVELSLPVFEIKGVEGFQFALEHATLDLSDVSNPASFKPSKEYMGKYFTLPDPKLWRGLYAERFTMTFPEWFSDSEASHRARLELAGLLIDENGITGELSGVNVLPLSVGSAGGWAFSVDSFNLSLLANNIRQFSFNGNIDIPISEESQLRPYEAYIAKDHYLFKATLGEKINFALFDKSELKIDPSSYLTLELRDRRFRPKVVLNGEMKLNLEGLHMEQVVFTKLSLSPDEFSVESMGYGGEVRLHNFPISVSEILFHADSRDASLGFNLSLNLMQEKIAAKSRLKLLAERPNAKWQLKGLNIETIKLDKVEMAGFSLAGEIRMEKDNPVYGNYFGGQITASIGALSSQLEIGATAVFGSTEFRYWYFEGHVSLPGVGIPVGPVSLKGFTGGAYYRMSATGKSGLEAYAPNDKVSLGLKAGIAMCIGSEAAVSAKALFEINFLSTGGINNIRFYGNAEFLNVVDLTDKLAFLDGVYKKAQAKLKDLGGSFGAGLASNLSGTEVAQSILPPEMEVKGSIGAYLSMEYDFPTKTFEANFKVIINVAGGIISGSGNNREAGWARLYSSPQKWFIHVGTPTNPCGIKIALASIELKTESYFMLGDVLEKPLPPPGALLSILKISAIEADYMKYPADMKLGKGVGFGARFQFDTGDLSFLIIYARFLAGMGFDLMLSDMSNYACRGSRTPVGINGWYANGQSFAYFMGELGIRIKIAGVINKKINIISGAAGTLLQARFPNPTWIGGYMAIDLNALGGLIKANMKMKFSFGDACELVSLNGDYTPVDFPIIADLSPVDRSTEVDVFLSPQATFNMPIGKPFDVEDDKGESKSYRIQLEDFYIQDGRNQRVEGTFKLSPDMNSATFISKEILTPYMDMKVYVSVTFEERSGGSWIKVNNARESRTASFKTGGAPNYIPLTNIAYCYPVVGQQNFYKGETTSGYIQLIKGQSYLFPANFSYNAAFSSQGQVSRAAFRYSQGESRIDYSIPASIANGMSYRLSFVASNTGSVQGRGETITTTTVVKGSEGEAFSIDYMQQAAQKIIKDGSLEVLSYAFRTSRYNTFAAKLTGIKSQFRYSFRRVNSDVISLILQVNGNYELFDEAELIGNAYSGGKPLVSVKAMMDDAYYRTDIAPLIYQWYPGYGISITNRDVSKYGVPPALAFPLYDGYLSFLQSNTYNSVLSGMFPYVYELPAVYYHDYYHLRDKAVNALVKGVASETLRKLASSSYPFVRQGDYKSLLNYTLPGGRAGSSVNLNYHNSLDWR
jgi:hypothetical protein